MKTPRYSNRMSPEELQAYLHHKKSGHVHTSKKNQLKSRKVKNKRAYQQMFS